jgi:hypothetical protein
MKSVLLLLVAFVVLAVVVGVFAYDVLSEQGGHDRVTRAKRIPFASEGMTREEYINYLLRTERHDDPELWVRIAAVRNLKHWPD